MLPELISGASTTVGIRRTVAESVNLAALFTDVDVETLTFTTASSLPAGLTLAANGTLSGTTTAAAAEFEISVVVSDGTAADNLTQEITLIVTGSTVAGDFSGSIDADDTGTIENATALTITDSSQEGDESFTLVDGTGRYGTLTLVDGTWTYDVDETNDDVLALATGEDLIDTFVITSDDTLGYQTLITITIDGANEAPTVGDDLALSLTADDDEAATLDLFSEVTDVDDTAFTITAVMYAVDEEDPAATLPLGVSVQLTFLP